MKRRKLAACQHEEITHYKYFPFLWSQEESILIKIVSSLTMKEAVRTSILSSRWRCLWTSTPNLCFDNYNMFGTDMEDISKLSVPSQVTFLEDKVSKFVRCVNEFLRHHQGVGLQTFKVDFFLNYNQADHLDRWISFAIASGVKNLTLQLTDWYSFLLTTEPYEFPYQLFAGGKGSSMERLCLHSCSFTVPPNFDGFNSLKSLYLENVNVTESGVNDLLSSCHDLELLSVIRSKGLVTLKIFHPSGQLKILIVKWCRPLQKIDFSLAVNLTTFEYRGTRVSLVCKNTPRLKRAFIYIDKLADGLDYVLTGLPQDLPHLETLFFSFSHFSKVENFPVLSNKFIHLKYIATFVWENSSEDLLWLASLLSAAPLLEKFELHLLLPKSYPKGVIKRQAKCPHNHLKTIEISGFTGTVRQMEIALCMLSNAIALEMMTITVCQKFYKGNGEWEFRRSQPLSSKARSMASKYLYPEVPPGAQLVFL